MNKSRDIPHRINIGQELGERSNSDTDRTTRSDCDSEGDFHFLTAVNWPRFLIAHGGGQMADLALARLRRSSVEKPSYATSLTPPGPHRGAISWRRRDSDNGDNLRLVSPFRVDGGDGGWPIAFSSYKSRSTESRKFRHRHQGPIE